MSAGQVTDPAVRKDGCCAQCAKPRNAVLGAIGKPGTNQAAVEQALKDPFCTSECCRRFHGCPLPEPAHAWKGEKGGQVAARRWVETHGKSQSFSRKVAA